MWCGETELPLGLYRVAAGQCQTVRSWATLTQVAVTSQKITLMADKFAFKSTAVPVRMLPIVKFQLIFFFKVNSKYEGEIYKVSKY